MRIGSLTLAVVLLTPCLSGAQPNGMPPAGMPGGMPRVEQVQLTDETAKAAIDSYLEIKEEYGSDAVPKTKMGAVAKGAEVNAGVSSIVGKAGFAGVPEWQKTITSVALAYGAVKEGTAGDLDDSLAKIDANPQIPEGMREQMKAMIQSTRPSANNIAVMKAIAADPAYAAKLKTIRD